MNRFTPSITFIILWTSFWLAAVAQGNESCDVLFTDLAENYYRNESELSLELKRNYIALHKNPNDAYRVLKALGASNIPLLSQRSPEYWDLLLDYRRRLDTFRRPPPSVRQDLEYVAGELSPNTGALGFFWTFKHGYMPVYRGRRIPAAIGINQEDTGMSEYQTALSIVHEIAHAAFEQNISEVIPRHSLFADGFRLKDKTKTWPDGSRITDATLDLLYDTYGFVHEYVAFYEQTAARRSFRVAPKPGTERMPEVAEFTYGINLVYESDMPQGLWGFSVMSASIMHRQAIPFESLRPHHFLQEIVEHSQNTSTLQRQLWLAASSSNTNAISTRSSYGKILETAKLIQQRIQHMPHDQLVFDTLHN